MAISHPKPPLVALARAAAAGNRDALEHFLTEVHPILRRYASRVLGEDRDLPSDVAQEALVRISIGLPQARAETEEQILAWCLTIVRHLAIDWLRRLRLEPSHGAVSGVGDAPAHLGGEGNIPPAPETVQLFRILSICEAELPLETRSILYLRLVEGAPWAELARELGVPMTAAKRRYQRAQRSLYQRVLQRVASLSEPFRDTILDQIRGFGVSEESSARTRNTRSPDVSQERPRAPQDPKRDSPG